MGYLAFSLDPLSMGYFIAISQNNHQDDEFHNGSVLNWILSEFYDVNGV